MASEKERAPPSVRTCWRGGRSRSGASGVSVAGRRHRACSLPPEAGRRWSGAAATRDDATSARRVAKAIGGMRRSPGSQARMVARHARARKRWCRSSKRNGRDKGPGRPIIRSIEEAVIHLDHAAAARVDQDHVVAVADPALIAEARLRQAIGAGVDPVRRGRSSSARSDGRALRGGSDSPEDRDRRHDGRRRRCCGDSRANPRAAPADLRAVRDARRGRRRGRHSAGRRAELAAILPYLARIAADLAVALGTARPSGPGWRRRAPPG